MSKVVFLRQVELTVESDDAAQEFSAAMFAPLNAYCDSLTEQLAAHGPRGLRAVRATVRLSPTLRAALAAPDAFDLQIEEDREA